MKINESSDRIVNTFPNVNSVSKGQAKIGFDSILKETAKKNLEQTSLEKKGDIDITASKKMRIDNTGQIIKSVENLLNTLEEYSHKLKDTKIPLKDIVPLIERLEKEKINLSPAIQCISDKDSLKVILNKTIEYSSNEILRFNRGDYTVK